jgi:hypothetical protein
MQRVRILFFLSICSWGDWLFSRLHTHSHKPGKELLIFSWNAHCNGTFISFYNYVGTTCSGNSVLTRTYATNTCRNCNNAACKD